MTFLSSSFFGKKQDRNINYAQNELTIFHYKTHGAEDCLSITCTSKWTLEFPSITVWAFHPRLSRSVRKKCSPVWGSSRGVGADRRKGAEGGGKKTKKNKMNDHRFLFLCS